MPVYESHNFLGLREALLRLVNELRIRIDTQLGGSYYIYQVDDWWSIKHAGPSSKPVINVWALYKKESREVIASGINVFSPASGEVSISSTEPNGWEHCLVSWAAGLTKEYRRRLQNDCIILSNDPKRKQRAQPRPIIRS